MKATLKKLSSLFILFLFMAASSFSQQLAADSLLQELKKILVAPTTDSIKFENADRFSQDILHAHPSLAIDFANGALNYIEHTEFSHETKLNLLACFTVFDGDAYSAWESDNTKKIAAYLEAEKLYHQAGNTFQYANMHRLIGRLYYLQGNHERGYQYLAETKKIADSTGDKRILCKMYWMLEDFSDQEGNYEQALGYQNKILSLSQELKDTVSIAKTYQNLGDLYSSLKDFAKAAQYFELAIPWLTIINDSGGMAWNFRMMGMNYSRQHQSPQALTYFNKSLAIDLRLNGVWGIEEDYRCISNEYDTLKNYKQSLSYYRMYATLHDSGIRKFYTVRSADMEAKYETEKKDDKIMLLDKEEKLQQAKAEKQKLLNNYYVFVFILVAIIAIVVFYRYRVRVKQKQEAERARISRDLHDDIGATLGSISIYSEVAKKKSTTNGKEMNAVLEKIGDSSREMVEKMSDIVWAVNPKNDNAAQLFLRMKNFAALMLTPQKIHFTFETNSIEINQLKLGMQQRKNIFLIYKEAIHNIVKYSHARNVSVRFLLNGNNIHFEIADDGKGFDDSSAVAYNGNGIPNMKERAEEIRAQFEIVSMANRGTQIRLKVPV
ncbi:MAG TPA: tetratricopeptide repeat protein [Chitinophagales bacterium]|nr:tetratricopeptide repeat protein [Chitinophagales bacterium]